jgi:hypothetical protein
MPNISLPTGKVIYLSTYEWLFKLEEKDVDEFYQNSIADDLGVFIENPFSATCPQGKIEVEDIPDIILSEETAVATDWN